MIGNFFGGRNSFCGITREMVLNKAKSLDMSRERGGFEYSNFGYAVLGLVLESVYETEYTALVNEYVRNDLGLTATKISDQRGDLGNYWAWEANDGYLSDCSTRRKPNSRTDRTQPVAELPERYRQNLADLYGKRGAAVGKV